MARQAPTKVRCMLQSFEPFNDDVACIRIKPVLGTLPQIRFGQYLIARLSNGHEVPLSIANVPSLNDNVIELHIDHGGRRRAPRAVVDQLNQERMIDIALPHGNVWIEHADNAPLMLLASGTGFAQSRAILEGLLRDEISTSVCLFWRTREADGFYQTELLRQWDDRFPGFRYRLVCCTRENEERFHRQVAEEIDLLACRRVIASGSKRFAESCRAWHCSADAGAVEIESDMLGPPRNADDSRLQAGIGHG